MNENNQYVVQEQINNVQPPKKKFNVIIWSVIVVVISIVITLILKGVATSMASSGEAAIPLATFIESMATLIPFVLIPVGIGIVVIIGSIKNKK